MSSVCRCTPRLLGWARRQGAESQCPPCEGPREKEACTNTLEKWREKCFEHHWPNDLLTAARSTPPGRRCRGQPFFMGFSWGFQGVFMGFSWGFHGVFMGCRLDTRNAMFLYIKSAFWGVPGGPRAIVPFRPYIILSTKWDGTLHGSPPATALYRGPRSKRGGRTDTPKIQRAVNFHVAYGAPRIPPPHLLLRHVGALFLEGAPLRHPTRLLSTESAPPSPPRRLLRGGAWRR